MTSTKTREIYSFNLLKAAKLDVSASYAYLVSRLIDIESKQSSGVSSTSEFAKQVLSAYESSETGFAIDRICLSFASPMSRKLSILSTYNTDSFGVEDLVPGYHCYVAPSSSLFAKPFGLEQYGRVRVYSDIDKVIQTFLSRGMPIQRTIGRLAAAGFKSGLSLSLSLGSWGNGLLFLNSKTVGAFDEFEDADYLTTCILRMVATATVLRSNVVPPILDDQLIEVVSSMDQIKNVCYPSQFASALATAIRLRFGLSLDVQVGGALHRPFFYPTPTAILLILKAMESSDLSTDEPIRLELTTDEPDLMRIFVDFGIRQVRQLEEKALAFFPLVAAAGFSVRSMPTGFELSTIYQIASDEELRCDYSAL